MADSQRTRMRAVFRFCAECMGADMGLTDSQAIQQSKKLVQACPSATCPLYPFRNSRAGSSKGYHAGPESRRPVGPVGG